MILVAIGANLGRGEDGKRATCAAAADAVASLPLLRAGRAGAVLSPWFDTAPLPRGEGPRFVNGVLGIAGGGAGDDPVDPAALLRALQRIERRFGRRRVPGVADAPRTLDLDIVAIGDLVRDGTDPILPHPRAHLRRFVLEPLACVCPGWRHPVSGLGVGALLAGLPDQGVRRLGGGGA